MKRNHCITNIKLTVFSLHENKSSSISNSYTTVPYTNLTKLDLCQTQSNYREHLIQTKLELEQKSFLSEHPNDQKQATDLGEIRENIFDGLLTNQIPTGILMVLFSVGGTLLIEAFLVCSMIKLDVRGYWRWTSPISSQVSKCSSGF